MKNLCAAVAIAAMMIVFAGPAGAADARPVSVAALLDEFKQDEAAAKQKYMNKRVIAEGKVQAVESAAGGPELVFAAEDSSSGKLVCQFPKSMGKDIAKIAKGRNVVVVGTVNAFDSNSLRLVNCMFGQPRRQ